jgi:O-acetylserine/cysteine efflux transporter
VIKSALAELPPLLFATLRFFFVLVPAIFFLPRPKASWGNMAAYGLLIGAGQFGLLYIALRGDISPGLASLVIQTQVFVTIGLSMLFAKDSRLKLYQGVALVCAICGIVLIGMHTDSTVTLKGLGLTLGAAFCWACGNLANKKAGAVNMIAYVVWASLFSFPALLAMALLVEGGPAITQSLMHVHATTWLAVLWQSVGNTMFGYVVWGWLLARYPAATVAPMALLVPIFGMGSASLLLHEAMPLWKLTAAMLVIGGLALNLFWPHVISKLSLRNAAPD